MAQFIPEVTDEDVRRVLERDYAAEHHARIERLVEAVPDRSFASRPRFSARSAAARVRGTAR